MPDLPKPAGGLEAILCIEPGQIQAFVPPLSDYTAASANWREAEYRVHEMPASRVMTGYWQGEKGEVRFDEWPYTEICSILSGRVGLRDSYGHVREFGPGTGFIIPKGWTGDWLTLQSSTKFFIAVS